MMMKTKITDRSILNFSLLFLLAFSIFSMSCKKEEQEQAAEESYPSYVHLNFHNSVYSEHYIYLIETRIMDEFGNHYDENWSENIINPGAHIKPNDSASFFITMDRKDICEFRFGVIDELGHLVLIHEQEGWYSPINPFFSRGGSSDEEEFSVRAVTASDGLIYINNWQ